MTDLEKRADAWAENGWLKLNARVFTPALMALFVTAGSIIGWFALDLLARVRDDIKEARANTATMSQTFWETQRRTNEALNEVANKLGIISERIDRVKEHSEDSDRNIVERLERLERARR